MFFLSRFPDKSYWRQDKNNLLVNESVKNDIKAFICHLKRSEGSKS